MFSTTVSSSWPMAPVSCCWMASRLKPGIWLIAANWPHTVSRSSAVGATVSVSVSVSDAVLSADCISARPVIAIPVCPAGALAACAAAIYSTMSGVVMLSSRAVRSSAVRSERSCKTPSSCR